MSTAIFGAILVTIWYYHPEYSGEYNFPFVVWTHLSNVYKYNPFYILSVPFPARHNSENNVRNTNAIIVQIVLGDT